MSVRTAILAFAVSLTVSFTAIFANAAEALTTFNVILLQPDPVLQARVPDIDALAAYIQALQAQARVSVPGPGAANSGFIVVALRPGGRSNAWLDFDDPLNEGVSEALVKRLRAVTVPPVQGGAVVFALKVGIWGGKESSRVAPAPAEWRDAAAKAGHALEPGELALSIWKD